MTTTRSEGIGKLNLPTVGLGCAPLGNLFRARTDDEAAETLEAAWQAGIRYFDTAPHYGLGLSEQRLGRFLATKPRNDFIVSTKVGRLIRDNSGWDGVSADDQGFAVPARRRRVLDYTERGIRVSVEESLVRLGLDRVDILFVHDPERSGTIDATESGIRALAALRDEGLATAIGTGSLGVEALLWTVRGGLADVVMVANRFTLLDQSARPALVPACDTHDVDIVAAAVFNSGLLARAPDRDGRYDYGSVPEDVLARARAIAEVCAAFDVELPTAAMRYPLLDPRVASIVIGAGTAEELRQNVDRLDALVPPALWDELDARGLVPRPR
ncbi:aldo/keto reductase [Asanoa siamensis]|uniref:Oxidoreductase n=1 Tax=Asanoa siamensis TaxID=926357 RepID=A0ABQ4D2A9_9ACTN|nr:aldo/keto reductase [Asanoa siamensis]GIF77675.1 oxidoreductase [Asanoa siamensis]